MENGKCIDVARYRDTKEICGRIRILSPMFLGGASQEAEVRSFPFRGMLRYWWRVAQGDVGYEELAEREKRIFGGVSGKALASPVRAWLDNNQLKPRKCSPGSDMVMHPESHRDVNTTGYLAGMGHFDVNRTCYKLTAFDSESALNFNISTPATCQDSIMDVLSLFNEFGSLGARSRNGYGSIAISINNSSAGLFSLKELHRDFGRPFDTFFKPRAPQWPNGLALFEQNKTAIWETKDEFDTWDKALEELGKVYLELRTGRLKFTQHAKYSVDKRHILGYPIMHHTINSRGGKSGRMPKQLRLLVRVAPSGRLKGRIAHIPHLIPADKPWNNSLGFQKDVWLEIHDFLDKTTALKRVVL